MKFSPDNTQRNAIAHALQTGPVFRARKSQRQAFAKRLRSGRELEVTTRDLHMVRQGLFIDRNGRRQYDRFHEMSGRFVLPEGEAS